MFVTDKLGCLMLYPHVIHMLNKQSPGSALIYNSLACSVFWLFWLSYQYLPGDWLERLLWGSLIVARGSSPESPGWRMRMIFLVYCIASLYYVFVLSPSCPYVIYYPTVMARYSLFVVKVLLNPKQTNKQTRRPDSRLRLSAYRSPAGYT